MRKKELQNIIDRNAEPAELGCPIAQGQVIQAQGELDEIANKERLNWWACSNRWDECEEERNWRSEERNWGVEPDDA